MVCDRMLPGAVKDFEASNDSINAEVFNEGFLAALKNDTTHFQQQQAEKYFYEAREAAVKAKTEAMKKVGADFLAANATKKGVKTTASGLQYKVITQGTGAVPTATDDVKVNYEGRLIDGKVFDSSYKRGEPNTFKANQVIKGWTEALTMMPVGSKWELYIPYDLAYGERGAGNTDFHRRAARHCHAEERRSTRCQQNSDHCQETGHCRKESGKEEKIKLFLAEIPEICNFLCQIVAYFGKSYYFCHKI